MGSAFLNPAWWMAMAVIETFAMEADAFTRRQFEVVGTMGSIVLQPLEPPVVRLCLRDGSVGLSAGGGY